MQQRTWRGALALGLVGVVASVAWCVGCGGGTAPSSPPAAKGPPPAEEGWGPEEPLPTLLVVQAQFDRSGGGMKPLPAQLLLMREGPGGRWYRDAIEDPASNVFHKAMPWRDGILTIGAEMSPKPATLKHWVRADDGTWTATTLWTRAFEGSKINRFRDLEIGDVDGDGADELVIATHDRGVVAIGDEGADGAWTFTELGERADTFVHEIELGDVDGDGTAEIYATPSDRNKASGESQPGQVVQIRWDGSAWQWTELVSYEESHAKEILVADVDGSGTPELYVVREAHLVKEGGAKKRLDPVRIVRLDPGEGGWVATEVAELPDDQCRFLVPGDIDHDGTIELVAAGYKSGLWSLELQPDGTFEASGIDDDSGGFEHATHVADLDKDGQLEIYVAADTQKQFRRYIWKDGSFQRKVLGPIGIDGRSYISWNIQDGSF